MSDTDREHEWKEATDCDTPDEAGVMIEWVRAENVRLKLLVNASAAKDAEIAALEAQNKTARGMAELLYHRLMANGVTAESKATQEAAQVVGRWLETTGP